MRLSKCQKEVVRLLESGHKIMWNVLAGLLYIRDEYEEPVEISEKDLFALLNGGIIEQKGRAVMGICVYKLKAKIESTTD